MTRFVKIRPERGYGDQVFEVLERRGVSSNVEVLLRSANVRSRDARSLGFWIYEAHTYQDVDTTKACATARAASVRHAQAIGTRFHNGRRK